MASFGQGLDTAVPNDQFFDNLKGGGGVEGEPASRPPPEPVAILPHPRSAEYERGCKKRFPIISHHYPAQSEAVFPHIFLLTTYAQKPILKMVMAGTKCQPKVQWFTPLWCAITGSSVLPDACRLGGYNACAASRWLRSCA
jgi:hypothetical protein